MVMEKRWNHPGRQYKPVRKRRRIVLPVILAVLSLFIVINGALWAIYNTRTYPRTTVMGVAVGSVSYDSLVQKVEDAKVLPGSLTLTYKERKVPIVLSEWGIDKDASRSSASAREGQSWLPILNLFRAPVLAAPVAIDQKAFDAKAKALAQTFQAAPVDAALNLSDGSASIQADQAGYHLDASRLRAVVSGHLDKGKTTVPAPVKTTAAKVQAASLEVQKQEVNRQLDTSINLRYGGTAKKLSKADIAAWYSAAGQTYAPAVDAIIAYLNGIGQASGGLVKDSHNVATAIQTALTGHKDLDMTLSIVAPAKAFTYCTAVRGVSADELPTLRSKLASTFADTRGWSLNGQINFKYAASGCNFTVWLTAAAQMPSFGAICDSMWSCRVGPNVVINYDRWQNASPAWNQYGGTLQEYRSMVINHETGHWLGFGHDSCPGAGQQAPVMQQQSIDLQGCTFSPWPNASEKAVLKQSEGI
jgi:hypothetical protein